MLPFDPTPIAARLTQLFPGLWRVGVGLWRRGSVEGALVFERRGLWATVVAVAVLIALAEPATADSLNDALASAYLDNADLNAARAQLRGIDENVPQAMAGYRPTIGISGNVAAQDTRGVSNGPFGGVSPFQQVTWPRAVALTVNEPLFLGFRTTNSVKQAKNAVRAARAQLRNVEQQTLLNAVSAFMGVVQAQVVVNLNAQNVKFLREQLRAAQDRLNVGEGTRTDVAQADASLQAGLSAYAAAGSTLNAALATYQQVIGHAPTTIGASDHVERLLPKSKDAAIGIGLANHPTIIAAIFNIDVAEYNVKVLEGALLPSISLQGQIAHQDDQSSKGIWADTASLMVQGNIPIYDGGLGDSRVRQAKETLGQDRIQLDSSRAAVQQAVISSWGQLDAAKAQVEAAQAGVAANQLALSGVIEERKVGQRTTLDVLNAQQTLINSQVSLVQAAHDKVIAAYTLLAAIGGLYAQNLQLRVHIYDPAEHYELVKDKWGGLRTPDGR
jgi:outer membrane protein